MSSDAAAQAGADPHEFVLTWQRLSPEPGGHGWHVTKQPRYTALMDGHTITLRSVERPAPNLPRLTGDVRDCLQGVLDNHKALVTACIEMRRLTRDRLGEEDAMKWAEQINALDQMKAQAERALTKPEANDGQA